MSTMEVVKSPSAKALKFNIIKMLHTFAVVGITFASSLFMVSLASAATCEGLYEDGNYDEALPLCLAEKSYFMTGYIYGLKADCSNMEKYYRLSNSPSATGNLGLNLLYGWKGCTKDVPEGIRLLKEAVTGESLGFGSDLGDHYRNEGKPKLAIKYYSKAVTNPSYRDWSQDRARSSYPKLIKLLDAKALKDFHLSNFKRFHKVVPYDWAEVVSHDWLDVLSQRSSDYLQSNLNITERLDIFFNEELSSKIRCDWGEQLYSDAFAVLVSTLLDKQKLKRFTDSLCRGSREYFVAKTYELGLGNKEDLQEAFRIYLISGSLGNASAKVARDNIREQLSEEQVAEAVCLADYGMEPYYYQKLLCKF